MSEILVRQGVVTATMRWIVEKEVMDFLSKHRVEGTEFVDTNKAADDALANPPHDLVKEFLFQVGTLADHSDDGWAGAKSLGVAISLLDEDNKKIIEQKEAHNLGVVNVFIQPINLTTQS